MKVKKRNGKKKIIVRGQNWVSEHLSVFPIAELSVRCMRENNIFGWHCRLLTHNNCLRFLLLADCTAAAAHTSQRVNSLLRRSQAKTRPAYFLPFFLAFADYAVGVSGGLSDLFKLQR